MIRAMVGEQEWQEMESECCEDVEQRSGYAEINERIEYKFLWM